MSKKITINRVMKTVVRKVFTLITCVIIAMAAISPLFLTRTMASEDVQCSVVSYDTNFIYAVNNVNSNKVILDDKADLFTEDEENRLFQRMTGLSWGGSIFLVTTESNTYGDASAYAKAYYMDCISRQSGVIFLIDMDTRELMFYSDGAYGRDLTVGMMHIITDNVYKQASNGDYYGCADKAFSQLSDVLEGKKIAAPMKYASNACLAILIALIINYFFVRGVSKMAKPSNSEILNSIKVNFRFGNPGVRHTTTTRTYSPRSSGSGGSGGGGGGGGGGHSGGHSF